jgi:glyceraldehyde 3-phosphate dehydrogenase
MILFGRFNGTVVKEKQTETFVHCKHCEERNPADLKWNEVDVDVVAECTGFTTVKQLIEHIRWS